MSDEDWGDDAGDAGDDGGDWDDAGGAKGDDAGEWGSDAEMDEADGVGAGGGDGDAAANLSPDIQIANIYYEADDIRREDPKKALAKFREVVALAEKAKAEGTQLNDESKTSQFNSIVHIVCLLFTLHNQGDSSAGDGLKEMVSQYKTLLDWIPRVTRNESGDAIDRVLNVIASSRDFEFLLEMYNVTLQRLKGMPDTERMRFNVEMKLCRVYMDKGEYLKGQEVLNSLLHSCQTPSGQDDKKNKGSELLEIYALQILISSRRGDALKMKELYDRTKDLTGAVKDPRSQSIIRECWGIMFGDEGQWQKSYIEFYSAFTHYQEIGNQDKAKQCLKYVVVANMLSGGQQNVFDAREAKVYQNEPDIAAIVSLRAAYEKCDVDAFGKAMDEINLSKDKFMMTHLDSMILDFHKRAVLQTLKSYRRLKISFLASRLKIPAAQLETLLVQLILDGDVSGKMDQLTGIIDCTQRSTGGAKKYQAIAQWTATLKNLTQSSGHIAPQLGF